MEKKKKKASRDLRVRKVHVEVGISPKRWGLRPPIKTALTALLMQQLLLRPGAIHSSHNHFYKPSDTLLTKQHRGVLSELLGMSRFSLGLTRRVHAHLPIFTFYASNVVSAAAYAYRLMSSVSKTTTCFAIPEDLNGL